MLATGMLILSLSGMVKAQNKTPDYWQCVNRVGGSWQFGVAPAGCDANSFGEDSYIWDTFLPVVFKAQDSIDNERNRYMEELGAVIRESATIYIKKRKPNVNPEEVTGFVRAAFAMAHQESYWTHYRIFSDQRLKLMRGDSGHGHGLMQIDDRWHFVDVKKGIGWNLIQNIIYSYEQYYSSWEKSASASCVPSPKDYRARARAAYSAYNGGPSKICRWSNPNDRWAANDQGFVSKYDKQQWLGHIKSLTKQSSVNVECLMQGKENCPMRSPANEYQPPESGKLYETSSGEFCVYRNALLDCVTQERDVACLGKAAGISNLAINKLSPDNEKQEKKNINDRHSLCSQVGGKDFLGIGRTGLLQNDINLRATPAGQVLALVPKNSKLQLYDFEFREPVVLKRYYQVFWNGQWGYVFGGNSSDTRSWITSSDKPDLKAQIAGPGNTIRVTATNGINLRTAIGGTIVTVIPKGQLIKVSSIQVQSDNNEVYYFVTYKNQTGFIYSGRGLPEKTYTQWTEITTR